jgi:hypothetical protein
MTEVSPRSMVGIKVAVLLSFPCVQSHATRPALYMHLNVGCVLLNPLAHLMQAGVIVLEGCFNMHHMSVGDCRKFAT